MAKKKASKKVVKKTTKKTVKKTEAKKKGVKKKTTRKTAKKKAEEKATLVVQYITDTTSQWSPPSKFREKYESGFIDNLYSLTEDKKYLKMILKFRMAA